MDLVYVSLDSPLQMRFLVALLGSFQMVEYDYWSKRELVSLSPFQQVGDKCADRCVINALIGVHFFMRKFHTKQLLPHHHLALIQTSVAQD